MEEATLVRTYDACVHDLYEFASRRCGGDRGLAEDVTQEVWLRAVKAWKEGGLPDNPLAWLRTVARNLILNYYRRHHPVSLDVLPPGWEGVPPGWEGGLEGETMEPETPEAASLVNCGLSRLKPQQARLLEAFHLEGKRVAEIATLEGLSERAVEGRLRRARQKLKRHLETAVRGNGGRP